MILKITLIASQMRF